MGHDHHHGPAAGRAGERHRRPLTISLLLVLAFLVVQVVTGLLTGSLSLLSDAGHMATDALGLAMALAAIHLANRQDHRSARTFGLYRLEILAALANAVLLFGVAVYVLFEAVQRLSDPVEIASVPVFVVGLLGLAVNVVSFRLLREGASESINVEGAYLEVVADMLGSLGVVVGAVVIWTTGWTWVDPVVGAAIGVFILPRAFRLGREALRILLQQAPAGCRPGRDHRRPDRHRGRGRGARPAPVDADVGHGGADRARRHHRRAPSPTPSWTARERCCAERPWHLPRDPAGGAGLAPRLRRDRLVTASPSDGTRTGSDHATSEPSSTSSGARINSGTSTSGSGLTTWRREPAPWSSKRRAVTSRRRSIEPSAWL